MSNHGKLSSRQDSRLKVHSHINGQWTSNDKHGLLCLCGYRRLGKLLCLQATPGDPVIRTLLNFNIFLNFMSFGKITSSSPLLNIFEHIKFVDLLYFIDRVFKSFVLDVTASSVEILWNLGSLLLKQGVIFLYGKMIM
jgi:hypothetical protein